MKFEILGEISAIETFATASGIREIVRLRRVYGRGRWRKRKGIVRVRLTDGSIHLAEVHWYEAAGMAEGIQDQAPALRHGTMAKPQSKQLVVCVDNEGYAASLEKRKIYVALRDPAAEKHGLLRVVDESGEDYLYPKMFFRSIALPQAVRKAVLAAA